MNVTSKIVWSVGQVRLFIGILGIVFPLALLTGHYFFEDGGPLDSISAYYWRPPLHTFFIVFVLTLGGLLIYYQYQTADTWVSTVAGLGAIGVALFPQKLDEKANPWQTPVNFLHTFCAATFIAGLAFMAFFLFTRSEKTKTTFAAPLGQTRTALADVAHRFDRKTIERYLRPAGARYPLGMPKQKHWRNQIYEACGIVIAICLVLLGLIVVLKAHLPVPQPQVFWLETWALWAFGVAWFVKSGAVPFLNEQANSTEDDDMAQQRWASVLGALVGGIGIITGLVLMIAPLLVKSGSSASWLGVTVPGNALAYVSMVGIRNVAAGALLLGAASQPAPTQPSFARPLTVVALVWGLVQGWDALLLFRLPSPTIAIFAVLLALTSFVVVALTLGRRPADQDAGHSG
jgi:hypothetical protein